MRPIVDAMVQVLDCGKIVLFLDYNFTFLSLALVFLFINSFPRLL